MGRAATTSRTLNPGAGLEASAAVRYAERLLSSLGIKPTDTKDLIADHPALSWARSGLMGLTGRLDGPPLMCPVPIAACADGVIAALNSLARTNVLGDLKGSDLLAMRAQMTGLRRAGSISPGSSCRLLEASDGWIAVNLARDNDWVQVPAWLESDANDWEAVSRCLREKLLDTLVERGRLLGLAVVADVVTASATQSWMSVLSSSSKRTSETVFNKDKIPLVIDLSSLWAGPLCSSLLQKLGADVIKVESRLRPDGARQGSPAFFEALNAGKRNLTLDFNSAEGREQLQSLLRYADIVIEASRPRALRQIGIDAELITKDNPELTWISITGYGRREPEENWIAYGDDAGVAAGLSNLMHIATGERVICGDAIADPLTGMHAALAAWAGWLNSGSGLVSVAMRDVVAHCAGFDLPTTNEGLIARQHEWTSLAQAAGF